MSGVATRLGTPFESFEVVEAETVLFLILSDVLGVLAFIVDPFSFFGDDFGVSGVLGLLLPLIDVCGTGVAAELVVVITMGVAAAAIPRVTLAAATTLGTPPTTTPGGAITFRGTKAGAKFVKKLTTLPKTVIGVMPMIRPKRKKSLL